MATACGLTAANIYYAQPLIGPISVSLGLSPQAAGLIVTMTQVGYVAGLIFLVPLGDLIENRRLILSVLAVCVVSLIAAAHTTHAFLFLLAMFATGLSSVAVQMLIPLASHLAPDLARGRVVGLVTSGLMMGIMLSRPASSFITHATSWPMVFEVSAAAEAIMIIVLALWLPTRHPSARVRYGALIASMVRLARNNRVLQRRTFYQACLYSAFSLFWTTVPLFLASDPFRLSQADIALFSLAAVAGVIAAPLGGTLADAGRSRLATGCGVGAAAAGFVLALLPIAPASFRLGALTVAAILIDFGVSAVLVTSQRIIFSLDPEQRSRANGIFMALFFAGGAIGSAVGAWAYVQGGWTVAAAIGLALPVVGLVVFATEMPTREARSVPSR